MKSLEARLADRARREKEAEEQREENASIATSGTGGESESGGEEGGDGEYSTYTVEQLKEELDSRGLEYKGNAKKADLIAALEADDQE